MSCRYANEPQIGKNEKKKKKKKKTKERRGNLAVISRFVTQQLNAGYVRPDGNFLTSVKLNGNTLTSFAYWK